jgi:hypothetical protein
MPQSRAALLLLATLLACKDKAPADTGDTGTPAADDTFMVVVLPDTQIYAQRYPETFEAQLKWVAENREEHNIVFVSHVGDIVQNGDSDEQWAAAQAAYDWIEGLDLPHGFSAGGHDYWVGGDAHDNSCANFGHLDCDLTDFRENFGPDRYAGVDWYQASPSGKSSAQTVSAGGLDLLFLHLPQDTPRDEVDWAHEVLDAHPGHLTHLTTHRYLFDYRLTEDLPSPLNILPSGRFNALTYRLGGQTLHWTDGLDAETLWTELVSAHPNIWGVHCGHVDAEFHQVSTNTAGLPVYEVLADYQDMDDGGGGWMRLLTFSPSQGTIHVQSYSPTQDRFRDNGEGFDHSIHILESYMGSALSVLEDLGVSEEELVALLEEVKAEGPLRDEFYESLYGGGQRDSDFVIEVDFQAYTDAAR